MRFEDWKILKEGMLPKDYLSKEAEKVKKTAAEKFKSFYAVPDFEAFKRQGEPIQQSNLFTDEDLNTFSFNYETNGNLYSVDIWKGDNPKPLVTYYVKKGSLGEIVEILPDLIQGGGKVKGKFLTNAKEKVLREMNENVDLDPRDPKPETPVNRKGEKDDEYDYADPETIFEDLETYVKMVIKGTQPSLLITGSPGVGKTFLVTKILKDAGLEKEDDYIHVKGRSTAAGMFITLYENNGKIVIFDDCDSVFGNADAVNILKGALDSYGEREISWMVGRPLKTADGEAVPKQFVFTGRVIFISNLPQRKIDDAIKSRSFVLEVALTPEDMLAKMRKDLPNVNPEVPLSVREEALDFVEKVSKQAENLELNMRTLVKAIKILQEIDNLSIAKRLIMQQCSYK
jgi:hypothetical protein